MGHLLVIFTVIILLNMAWRSATPLFRETCRLFYERNAKTKVYKFILVIVFGIVAVYLSLIIGNL